MALMEEKIACSKCNKGHAAYVPYCPYCGTVQPGKLAQQAKGVEVENTPLPRVELEPLEFTPTTKATDNAGRLTTGQDANAEKEKAGRRATVEQKATEARKAEEARKPEEAKTVRITAEPVDAIPVIPQKTGHFPTKIIVVLLAIMFGAWYLLSSPTRVAKQEAASVPVKQAPMPQAAAPVSVAKQQEAISSVPMAIPQEPTPVPVEMPQQATLKPVPEPAQTDALLRGLRDGLLAHPAQTVHPKPDEKVIQLLGDARKYIAQGNYDKAEQAMKFCEMLDSENQECQQIKQKAAQLNDKMFNCVSAGKEWVDGRCN